MFMRALPGREARAKLDAPPASVTRSNAHVDQRRRILRAIGELVAERGYPDVTVEQIVKRAHVSYKTFYKHYRSKADCFVALFDVAFASTEGKIRRRLSAERSWPGQVALALRVLFEEIAAEPLISRAVIVETPMVGAEATARYERAFEAFVPLLRAGRELNPWGREMPVTVEETLMGAVFWSAYVRLLADEAEQLQAYLPVLLQLVLRTYLDPAEAGRIARAEAPQPAFA
jgi:AcrR family transcriptional regulator